jgi:hypothetical protein
MGKALYIQSVADAAALAGGYERLAEALGVTADEVERWSAGTTIPECAVFLRLIDIVLNPEIHLGTYRKAPQEERAVPPSASQLAY